MKELKHIIWDWNGTLFDDIELTVEVLNEILVECLADKIDPEKYERLFRHPVKLIYQDLGVDLEEYPFEEISQIFHDKYYKRYSKYSLRQGAQDIIHWCQDIGLSQSILSAFPDSHLMKVVSSHGIEDYFDTVIGQNNSLGAGKIETAKKLIEEHNLSPENVILIGDTNHDVETANAVEAECVLIYSGYQHLDILKKYEKPIFRSFSEVQDYLGTLLQ